MREYLLTKEPIHFQKLFTEFPAPNVVARTKALKKNTENQLLWPFQQVKKMGLQLSVIRALTFVRISIQRFVNSDSIDDSIKRKPQSIIKKK